MGLNFPSSAAVGQAYPSPAVAGLPVYRWDGQKWKTAGGGSPPSSAPPSTALPLMDSIAAPGTASLWSRGDHKHPSDSNRAPIDNPTFTGTFGAQTFNASGNITATGIITTTADGNQFGIAGPETYDATSPANCNILFYDFGSGNWAGIGADVNGFFYIRTGATSSSAVGAMVADTAKVGFTGNVYAPTPAVSNDTKVATTAYVTANQAIGGPYLPLSGGTVTGPLNISGDLYLYGYGGDSNKSVLYFGAPSQDRYFHYNGANYYFGNGLVYTANGRCWGDSDWTRPVVNARVGPFAGDYFVANTAGLTEPYGGAAHTGSISGLYGPPYGFTIRYRYNQILVEGTWYTAGYV